MKLISICAARSNLREIKMKCITTNLALSVMSNTQKQVSKRIARLRCDYRRRVPPKAELELVPMLAGGEGDE